MMCLKNIEKSPFKQRQSVYMRILVYQTRNICCFKHMEERYRFTRKTSYSGTIYPSHRITFPQKEDFLESFLSSRSSIGSEFAWHASGPEFDPHVRHILSWRLGHENISTAILPLPLIQEEQLSVTGERMCISTGKLPKRLAQEQCG